MIPFMKYRLLYVIISCVFIVPGLFVLLTQGLRPSIDFTGGTVLEVRIDNAQKQLTPTQAKDAAEKEKLDFSSLQTTTISTYILKLKTLNEEQKVSYLKALQDSTGSSFTVLRFETVGPTLGAELLRKTAVATVIAVTLILFYVAWAFKNVRNGVSAILALIHDVLAVVSVFALLGYFYQVEVDALFVTAVLTTMSFSVHDTIVVFDRIRELSKKGVGSTYEETVNFALSETMGRSLNNSLTIIFMLLALVLLGGESIRYFAFALLIGTISGTYSSPFVATPILFQWHLLRDRKK